MKPLFTAVRIIILLAFVQVSAEIQIINPYRYVDWSSFGQYKAALHVHSTNSDGRATRARMIERHYRRGFDIVAFTDHNFVAKTEESEIRRGRGIIVLSYTNEQSSGKHINTYFANYNNSARGDTPHFEKMRETVETVENLGGISIICHPGRSLGYRHRKISLDSGIAIVNNPDNIQKFAELFMEFPSLAGMEIVNSIDGSSRFDRIFWDNILKQTAPNGYFVWGFSNDDSHLRPAIGFAYNIMLLPKLSEENVRKSMETGAFYAVSHISNADGIRNFRRNRIPPRITDITVSGTTITISGRNYKEIDWIADGTKIASGNSIDVSEFTNTIGSYLRAQLRSRRGIAFTQPFGITNKNDN